MLKENIAQQDKSLKQKVQDKLTTQQQIANLKNLIREETAEKGSIEQRRAALIRLTKQYDALNAAERESAAGQRLAKITGDLTNQIKELEKTTGRTGRNVGNYQEDIEKAAKATGGFGAAVSKSYGFLRTLANIIPGLGISGIFLLAYQYGKQFFDLLVSGTEQINTAAENFKNLNEVVSNANKDAGKQIADLKILYTAATDVALSTRDRADAAIELQKTYPETFKNFSIEEIELGKAKTGYDELTKAIIATARAKAAKDKIDELEAQRLDVAFQKQKIINATNNENARAKDKTVLGGGFAVMVVQVLQ
jgi:ABC-type transporter Mla subunit MlaD